ncbi:BamA/TamA family outer membrane protein [Aquincola tertiaricarbonis]|uniref:BamA/TamA family outer membrane protein n=1 Tax=Aquincola tertiaricarbonis TaxID=391953 RepID=A0ABY4S3K7_AQUTE|nr:BamA/TamA family outer membrane protein [Aquincola tertiaricarbonis]URI08033.1 BamA/TamA family outer membrane protein [Aquincola tertiaricarbonis]
MIRRAGACLLLAACVVLPGCAWLKPPPPEPQGASEATLAPLAVELEVQAPGELRSLLENYLDLGRLRALAPDEPITPAELRRLEAATPAQARALLETEGYFDAQVQVQRVADNPPRVRVTVEPGQRTIVRDVVWDVKGPLQQAVEAGDRRAMAARSALQGNWPLPPGTPFRNAQWSNAKSSALAQLRASGYASASWESTRAEVDAVDQNAVLWVTAQSGPLFRTGELRIRGLQRHDEQTVRNLANFEPGTPATEQLLLDYQERLQKSGLYDRATVNIDTDPAVADATPVTVRLGELPLQTAIVGLGVSANTGPRATLEHIHRRIFGQRATLRNKFELAQLRQAWEGELTSHTLPGLKRNLVGGALERVESSDDVVKSARLRAGRAYDGERIDRLLFVEVEQSDTRNDLGTETARAISLNLHNTWRKVDNMLLPTDGVGLSLQTAVGQARSDNFDNTHATGPYARAYAKLQWWKPVGEDWYAHTRLELGQVFVKSNLSVPDSQRFRAGGDESVRGYGYRDLGPEENGVTRSGNVLMTASAEIATPITPRIPGLWWATFIDLGNAADRWSELSPALGVGAGVRYRSPLGPVSVDLAYGRETKSLRLHLNVGVQF